MKDVNSQMQMASSNGSLVCGCLLLFAISLPFTDVSDAASYTIILIVYGVLFFVAIGHVQRIVVSRVYVILLCFLSGSLVLSGIFSPSINSMVRIGAFFVFTLANLLIVPYIISFRDITFLTSRYAVGLVLLGFGPYFGVRSVLGVFDLSLWGGYLYVYPELQPVTSIFLNPNTLGFVLLVGAIAAVIETGYSQRRVPAMLMVFNAVGLLLTNYRTGMVAFAIVLSLCAVYVLFDHRIYSIAVTSGLATFALVLMMMFGLLPGPTWLMEVSLNGRRLLWRNAVSAIQQALLVGYGFGNYTEVVRNPHNSFLRIFLALGLSGGIMYTLFVMRSILQSTREATDWYYFGASLYLVAFFFVQVMNSLTFIGISFHSVLISLMIGYHIRNDGYWAYETNFRTSGS